MKIKQIALLAGIALSLGSLGAHAQEKHLQEAIKHAEEAGKAASGKTVAIHAEASKKHLLQTQEHLTAGIKALDDAVLQGNMEHADEAKKFAAEAVTHIKAAE